MSDLIRKIREAQVRAGEQAVVDHLKELGLTTEESPTQTLMQKLADAERDCVSGFYEDEFPMFTQGRPTHELQSLVTAEECQGYVARIGELQRELAAVKAERDAALERTERSEAVRDKLSAQIAAMTKEQTDARCKIDVRQATYYASVYANQRADKSDDAWLVFYSEHFARLVLEEAAKASESVEPRLKYGEHQYVCGHMEAKHEAARVIRSMKP